MKNSSFFTCILLFSFVLFVGESVWAGPRDRAGSLRKPRTLPTVKGLVANYDILRPSTDSPQLTIEFQIDTDHLEKKARAAAEALQLVFKDTDAAFKTNVGQRLDDLEKDRIGVLEFFKWMRGKKVLRGEEAAQILQQHYFQVFFGVLQDRRFSPEESDVEIKIGAIWTWLNSARERLTQHRTVVEMGLSPDLSCTGVAGRIPVEDRGSDQIGKTPDEKVMN